MNNKSSLSLIGAIVFGSLIKNLKSKGSAGLLISNPKDLEELEKTEIEVQFTCKALVERDLIERSDVDYNFKSIIDMSKNFSARYPNLSINRNDSLTILRNFIYSNRYSYGEIGTEIYEEIEGGHSIKGFLILLHHLKSIRIIRDNFPEDDYLDEESDAELTVLITVKFCREEEILRIVNSIGFLMRQNIFGSDVDTGNIIIDPNNKLSETVKSLIFGSKKSELRRF